MNTAEYLADLEKELRAVDCDNAQDIAREYASFFDYKRSQGYSDREMLRLMRSPGQVARPLGFLKRGEVSDTGRLLVWMALIFAGLFVGLFFVFMALMGVGVCLAALALIYTGALYLAGANPLMMLPHISIEFKEYWSGALMGLGLMALGAIMIILMIRTFFLWRALISCYNRFNKNAVLTAAGKPILPPKPLEAKMGAKLDRRLAIALSSAIVVFCLCFSLGFVSASMAAGQIAFWRAWKWG